MSGLSNSTLKQELHIIGVQFISITLSLILGFTAALFNSLLLFTIYKDPLKCFHKRASTIFIKGLALSDFLTGFFVHPTHSISLLFEIFYHKMEILDVIVTHGLHIGSKISVFTLVVLALDRLIAIVRPWKYNYLVTKRTTRVINVSIWVFVAVFEISSHAGHAVIDTVVIHSVDLHLQTTIPMVGLLIISVGTYLSFRKHTRNTIFAVNQCNRLTVRNLQFEKRLMATILFILLVVIVSLSPYLIVQQLSHACHDDLHNKHDHDAHAVELNITNAAKDRKSAIDMKDNMAHVDQCKDGSTLTIFHVLSVSLLCVSCVMHPVLYGWRLPQYRRSLQVAFKATFVSPSLSVNRPSPQDRDIIQHPANPACQ